MSGKQTKNTKNKYKLLLGRWGDRAEGKIREDKCEKAHENIICWIVVSSLLSVLELC